MTDLEKQIIRDALINHVQLVKEQLCANEVPVEEIDKHLEYLEATKKLAKKYTK